MQSMEPDKKTADTLKSLRLRAWLRANTHWRNTEEFFVAILFESGPPPHPMTAAYISSRGRLALGDWSEMHRWRVEVAGSMHKYLHHRLVDSNHVMQEYFKWLLAKQEKGNISAL